MKVKLLFSVLLLAACAEPETWESDCRSKYSDQVAIEMCVSNARSDYKDRMTNVSAALSRMSTGPQSMGAETGLQYRPAPGSASALTIGAAQLCPMQYGYSVLRGSTVSGMNRICVYK